MTAKIDFSDTDLCVKCGLCLPHCPTYTLSKNENESPRGRLALIQGWSEGQLELSNTLTQHIDTCLTCRACESMCPARVPYSRLVNDFRNETTTDSFSKLSGIERAAIKQLTSNNLKVPNTLLRTYQAFGLNKLPFEANQYLPKKISRCSIDKEHPTLNKNYRGHVALFTGCASKIVDTKTIKDAIFLLQHCGFDITIPENQTCCGAIDLHAGNKNKAIKLAETNQQVFSNDNYNAIITIASGCGSTLADYGTSIANKTIDISDFIAPYLSTLSFEPLNASAWLHTPCTLKNAQSKGASIPSLLSNIDELAIHSFSTEQQCCGAAGTYMLTHKETANKLRDQTLQPVFQLTSDYLLTSNIGCAMHLRAGLKQAGLNTDALHPVSLLAQQLKV